MHLWQLSSNCILRSSFGRQRRLCARSTIEMHHVPRRTNRGMLRKSRLSRSNHLFTLHQDGSEGIDSRSGFKLETTHGRSGFINQLEFLWTPHAEKFLMSAPSASINRICQRMMLGLSIPAISSLRRKIYSRWKSEREKEHFSSNKQCVNPIRISSASNGLRNSGDMRRIVCAGENFPISAFCILMPPNSVVIGCPTKSPPSFTCTSAILGRRRVTINAALFKTKHFDTFTES